MIESVLGVENLEKICAIPGVNAVFVGPNDLTTSMGIPNEYDHPDLIAMLQHIIDTANRSHVAAGCWFGKREQAERTIKQGAPSCGLLQRWRDDGRGHSTGVFATA